jgi:hypothetical protein
MCTAYDERPVETPAAVREGEAVAAGPPWQATQLIPHEAIDSPLLLCSSLLEGDRDLVAAVAIEVGSGAHSADRVTAKIRLAEGGAVMAERAA